MIQKKKEAPKEPSLPQYFYGDGVTPDPMLRDRGFNAKRLQRLESRQQPTEATDGLDRELPESDTVAGC